MAKGKNKGKNKGGKNANRHKIPFLTKKQQQRVDEENAARFAAQQGMADNPETTAAAPANAPAESVPTGETPSQSGLTPQQADMVRQETQRHLSERQLIANKLNAQLSSGPNSEAGIAVSKMNAATHGGYAQNCLLPGEDVEAFNAYMADWLAYFEPRTMMQKHLVAIVVDRGWRLQRIKRVEDGLYQKLADDPVELLRQLDILSKVETRLQNKMDKALKELEKDRKELLASVEAGKQEPPPPHSPALWLNQVINAPLPASVIPGGTLSQRTRQSASAEAEASGPPPQ